ncbi:MAG: aldo/keto reductase [Endozoicomonas sp. (ex Botrylloides leachii)]|nr:aldo/keto reductase [Endozoicomonas sp. (ex Botrylloides leachii)]
MPIMPKRKIIGTDIFVSPIGLGTVKLGRDQQVNYLKRFKIPDDKAICQLLDLAQSMGVNLLDTAPAYGTSEERLGKLLGYRRTDWVICSKVGEEFQNGASHFDFSPEHIRFSVQRSLKRLNIDYLDIVLIHSSGEDATIIQKYGCLDVLADLKKEGLIRASGMSSKTVEGGCLALERSDIAMVTYNIADQSQQPVLDFAAQQGKGILVKKALASGHACLSGSIDESIAFVFAHPAVSSAVVGTINPTHLRENIEAIDHVFTGRL